MSEHSNSSLSQDNNAKHNKTKVKKHNSFHKGQSFNKSPNSLQSRSLIEHYLVTGKLPSQGSVSSNLSNQSPSRYSKSKIQNYTNNIARSLPAYQYDNKRSLLDYF